MQDKVVLITGGTGSFGKEFAKECLNKGVKQVRIYSRDELKQSQLKEEIQDRRLECLIGDVRDYDRLCTAMQGVDICVHAAAMKRIEACEKDPQEAIKTNVQGSVNVANACLKSDVKAAILISTDKAVYPVNLYGATKLVAEKAWCQSNTYRGVNHPTKFSVVRYGNVLGSRGSVLHLFKDQLEQGALKVTDTRMTRFFITLQEAVDLVQLALEFMQGGEIFVPTLKSASIYELAQLIAGEVPVEVTNQRGGEKLHESLITKEEKDRLASFNHYSVINPEITTWVYEKWVSEFREYYASSEIAPKYNSEELNELIRTI